MGWDNSYQTIITLPSGATSGARIVLDGTGDRILVYDAAGTLVASVAPSDGTLPDGTTYLEGITNYSENGQEYVQMGFGNTLYGVRPDPNDPTFQPDPGLVGITGDSSGISVQSASNQDLPESVIVDLRSGNPSLGMGKFDYPHVEIQRGDLWCDRTLIKAIVPAGQGFAIPATWQTPTMNSGWATGSSASPNYQGVKYRFLAEDMVYVFGAAHATASPPSNTVFTLADSDGSTPSYRPSPTGETGSATIFGCGCIVQTTSTDAAKGSGRLNVQSAGQVVIGGLTVATGDNIYFNHVFPLGNIP